MSAVTGHNADEHVPDTRPMVPSRNPNCPLCKERKQYRRPEYDEFTTAMKDMWFETVLKGLEIASKPDANGVVSPYPWHDAGVYADNIMNEYTKRFGHDDND